MMRVVYCVLRIFTTGHFFRNAFLCRLSRFLPGLSKDIRIFSIFREKRDLSLPKAVGFDRLTQLYRDLLRRCRYSIKSSRSRHNFIFALSKSVHSTNPALSWAGFRAGLPE